MKAPFTGVLLPNDHFIEAATALEELAICELRLENKRCGDSLEDEWERARTHGTIGFAGFLLGVATMMMVR